VQEIPARLSEEREPPWICIAVEAFTPFATAVRVIVPADAAGETLRLKLALSAFWGIMAVVGIDTAALLLASCTPTPPLGAGPLNAIVHASDPGAVNAE
jgi:hypothetical protein